jgi:hypothetical protein
MIYLWWQKIQGNYPRALDACKAHFQSRHSDDWRTRIKDPKNLITFFEQHHTQINIQWTPKPVFGYRIKSKDFQITGQYLFPNQEVASFSAADFGFKILEWDIQRKNTRVEVPRVMFQRKEKRESTGIGVRRRWSRGWGTTTGGNKPIQSDQSR